MAQRGAALILPIAAAAALPNEGAPPLASLSVQAKVTKVECYLCGRAPSNKHSSTIRVFGSARNGLALRLGRLVQTSNRVGTRSDHRVTQIHYKAKLAAAAILNGFSCHLESRRLAEFGLVWFAIPLN